MPQYQFYNSAERTERRERLLDYRYLSKVRRSELLWEQAGGRREWEALARKLGSCVLCRRPRSNSPDPNRREYCNAHLTLFSWERRQYERNIMCGVCVVCKVRPAIEEVKYRDRGREEYTTYKVYCDDCEAEYRKLVYLYLQHLYYKLQENSRLLGLPAPEFHEFLEADKTQRRVYHLEAYGIPGFFIHFDPQTIRPRKQVRRCIVKPCKGRVVEGQPACKRHEQRIFYHYNGYDACLLKTCKKPAQAPFALCEDHLNLVDPKLPWPLEVTDYVRRWDERLARRQAMEPSPYFKEKLAEYARRP